MRGDIFRGDTAPPTVSAAPEAVTPSTAPEAGALSNLTENTKPARKPGSVWFWLALLLLYLGMDYIHTHRRVQESLEPKNVRANIHNMAVIGLATVIFINGMNVLLTKLASMRIPVISKAAGAFLPLFSL